MKNGTDNNIGLVLLAALVLIILIIGLAGGDNSSGDAYVLPERTDTTHARSDQIRDKYWDTASGSWSANSNQTVNGKRGED